jgi:hypothetical protein
MCPKLHDVTAVLPPCGQAEAVALVEGYFGTHLRAGDSSYFNTIWRWEQHWVTPRWKFWKRKIVPVPGVVQIWLHDNEEPPEGELWHEGHPPDSWVVRVCVEGRYPIAELRDFLATHGTLVDE